MATPILIFWVIGMPVIAIVLLFRSRKDSDDSKIKQYFLILYQGLKPKRFYWEFANTLRKLAILTVLLLPDTFKIAFASVILIISGRFQMSLKPYKNKDNNEIELLAITTGVLTILSSLIFAEEDKVTTINNFVIFTIIILNIIFLTQWLLLLLQIFEEKHKAIRTVGFVFHLFLLANTDSFKDILKGC